MSDHSSHLILLDESNKKFSRNGLFNDHKKVWKGAQIWGFPDIWLPPTSFSASTTQEEESLAQNAWNDLDADGFQGHKQDPKIQQPERIRGYLEIMRVLKKRNKL